MGSMIKKDQKKISTYLIIINDKTFYDHCTTSGSEKTEEIAYSDGLRNFLYERSLIKGPFEWSFLLGNRIFSNAAKLEN